MKTPARRLRSRPPTLAAGKALVFADQQLEVLLLFLGKLHENLLAFRIFEALTVLLEEVMRAALALDADEQRLLIVDTLAEPVGALGEETIRRSLEEEKR